MLDKVDIQNVQGKESSSTGLGSTALNNKSIAYLLIIIYKSVLTDANMLETTHCDTNANLYQMHTFLNLYIASLSFMPMRIGESYSPYYLQY